MKCCYHARYDVLIPKMSDDPISFVFLGSSFVFQTCNSGASFFIVIFSIILYRPKEDIHERWQKSDVLVLGLVLGLWSNCINQLEKIKLMVILPWAIQNKWNSVWPKMINNRNTQNLYHLGYAGYGVSKYQNITVWYFRTNTMWYL